MSRYRVGGFCTQEEYHPEEMLKITEDINMRGLSLLVFADWYNVDTMVKMRFFDDNTRSWCASHLKSNRARIVPVHS